MNKRRLLVLGGLLIATIFIPYGIGELYGDIPNILDWVLGVFTLFIGCICLVPLGYLSIIIYQWLTNREVFDWEEYIDELSDIVDNVGEWLKK